MRWDPWTPRHKWKCSRGGWSVYWHVALFAMFMMSTGTTRLIIEHVRCLHCLSDGGAGGHQLKGHFRCISTKSRVSMPTTRRSSSGAAPHLAQESTCQTENRAVLRSRRVTLHPNSIRCGVLRRPSLCMYRKRAEIRGGGLLG